MEKERRIPQINIEGKRIVEETKEVPLIINGIEEKIVLRKLRTGERNKIRSEVTKTTMMGGMPKVEVNESEIQEKILHLAIIKAPFDTSIQGIKNLPAEVTDYLFDEYTKFAEPTDKKKD